MKRWDQPQFLLHEDPTGSGPVIYTFRAPETGGILGLVFGESSETIWERVLGCYALATMPENALRETLVQLRDTLEFYREETVAPKPAPPRIYRNDAPIARRTKRPDLDFEE